MHTKDDIEYSRAYLASNKRVMDLIRLETLVNQTDLAFKRLEKAVHENKGRVTKGQTKSYLADITQFSKLVSFAKNCKLLEAEIGFREKAITAVSLACDFIETGFKKSHQGQ